MSHPRPPILDDLSAAIRTRHHSPPTEKAYAHWVLRFLRYHGSRPIENLGVPEVNAFLAQLAGADRVSASTQSQARAALLFLYRHVLRRPLAIDGNTSPVVRVRTPKHLPVVLSRAEVRNLLAATRGPARTVALLLYGGGLRPMRRCACACTIWMPNGAK